MDSDSRQALNYIALTCDAKQNNTDSENLQFKKANQYRLNQNFSLLSNAIEALEKRLSELESQ